MDIKEIINQRYAMPDASLDRLRQCLSEVSYPKGFRVLENGKIEKDIFFIKNGIVRAYTSVDGKEITFWVGKEGATLVSMKGYVNDEPGYETMELMEDSVLYVLKKKKLKELFSPHKMKLRDYFANQNYCIKFKKKQNQLKSKL